MNPANWLTGSILARNSRNKNFARHGIGGFGDWLISILDYFQKN